MSYTTPDLGYAANALEPIIDEKTMTIHHGKHHAGYTSKLNNALVGTSLAEKSPVDLLKTLSSLPDDVRTAVRNNGGGHVNHSLFWEILTPGGRPEPEGELLKSIEKDLGGYKAFQNIFSQTAVSQFGSGWAWLILSKNGKLDVVSTPNQDSPYSNGDVPLLGIDVWEHAYYLNYQNRRAEYVEKVLTIINWDVVDQFYRNALNSK